MWNWKYNWREKNKLKENIKLLEELENKFDENIKELKDIFQKIEKDKEDLKFKIINIFTKLRNTLNEREDKLLKEVDNIYENNYFNEDIIQKGEKLPKQIKLSLEKGKLINKEWDNDNIYSYINDCINIENNIKILGRVKDNINKYKDKKRIKIEFIPKENLLNNFIDTLNSFGKIIMNNLDSKIINNNEKYYENLKNWINPSKKIKTELLYRLSENGDDKKTFHELCDNKGPTLTLFHVNDGNIVGIYTPLSWDSTSNWKNDMETFIFNLNKNQKYKKLKSECSIYCTSSYGPYTAYFGLNDSMKSITHWGNDINNYYDKGSEILPINNQKKEYDLIETEVYKIIFE